MIKVTVITFLVVLIAVMAAASISEEEEDHVQSRERRGLISLGFEAYLRGLNAIDRAKIKLQSKFKS